MRAVLLDVEGTTTPKRFVYDVLFPYARGRVGDFVRSADGDPDVRALREECRAESGSGDDDALARHIRKLIDADRKSGPLKSIQGRIWESGYRTGELVGEVYPDVPGALRRWQARGIGVCVYSSGSVLAQRLLFGHTSAGDLTPCIERHFDTAVGAKRDESSYRAIAQLLGLAPDAVTFVSDVVAELAAARAAGMHAVLCSRPEDDGEPLTAWRPSVATLDDAVLPRSTSLDQSGQLQ
jgi:enolase-phosphatase E1